MLPDFSSLEVSELLDAFGGDDPRTVRLACAVAAWPYIPYAELRRHRLLINSKWPTHLETDLCRSSLVDGCAVDGFSLVASFRIAALTVLRSNCLRGSTEFGRELTRLGTLLSKRGSVLSPLLQLEAEIALDYVRLSTDDFQSRLDARLHDVLLSAIKQNRNGILHWYGSAAARLPPDCLTGELAWLLYQLCQSKKIAMAPVSAPSIISPAGLMSLFASQLPTVVVGTDRRNGHIEFGPPSPERSVGIMLPETDPLIVTMQERSPTGELTEAEQVQIKRGQPVRVKCSSGELVLGNLLGQTFTLAKMTSEISEETRKANFGVFKAQHVRDKATPLKATVIRSVEAGYVVSLHELEVTAFMISPERELFEGEVVTVVVDRVYADRRWIGVRPISYATLSESMQRSTLLHIPRDCVPRSVEPGDVFAGTIFKIGRIRGGNRRSAHVFVDPQCLLGNVSHNRKPGHLRFPGAVREIDGNWTPKPRDQVEIVAAGIIGGLWELRLRLNPAAHHKDLPAKSLTSRNRTAATVIEIDTDGVWLEAQNGQHLWLSCREMYPPLPYGESITLKLGETLDVRILGFVGNSRRRFIASQRALAEPYLENMERGSVVVGTIVDRMRAGAYIVRLDPIPGVSNRPFYVQTSLDPPANLRVGMRVSARVANLIRIHWIRIVSDIQPLESAAE